MKNIFEFRKLESSNLFQKLVGKKRPQNFIIEINNLLAQKYLLDINPSEIVNIAMNYSDNIFKVNSKEISHFYSIYLKSCLTDKFLSEKEINELRHLKLILSLNDGCVKEIHNQVVSDIYKNEFQKIINDGKIEEDEIVFLEKLKNDLQLPDDISDELSSQVRGDFVRNVLENIVSYGELSPDDERQFDLLCKNLHVTIKLDEGKRNQLNRLKYLWQIENGEIPSIDVTLSLENGEKCYFQSNCKWFEMRTVTRRVNYSGATASISIMKGVRYRIGTISPRRVTNEELTEIESGKIYLTNKRIIFIGGNRNLTVRLPKILSFIPYTDGVEICKDSGRNPMFKFNDNNDIFNMILSRLLNE